MNFRVGVSHLSVGQCGVRNAVTVDDRADDGVDDEVDDGSSVQLVSRIAMMLQAVLIKHPPFNGGRRAIHGLQYGRSCAVCGRRTSFQPDHEQALACDYDQS